MSEYSKQYRAKNKDKLNAQDRERWAINKDERNRKQRERRAKNREQINAKKREARRSGKYKATDEAYKQSHKEEAREYDKLWKRKFRQTDKYKEYDQQRRNLPNVKLHQNISRMLRNQLHRKSKHTVEYIGCSIPFLMQYFEALFYPGKDNQPMTMENYGEWHIDHIIPLSIFNANNKDAINACWNYNNLRPMWGPENMSKSNHIEDVKHIYRYFLDILPDSLQLGIRGIDKEESNNTQPHSSNETSAEEGNSNSNSHQEPQQSEEASEAPTDIAADQCSNPVILANTPDDRPQNPPTI